MLTKFRLAAVGVTVALAAAAATALAGAPSAQASTAACGVSCTTPTNLAGGTGLALTITVSTASNSGGGGGGGCGVLCGMSSPASKGTSAKSQSSQSNACAISGSTFTAIALETALASGNCAVSVGLAAAASANPAQDWVVLAEGTVQNAITYGVLSQRLGLVYLSDQVVEFEAVPNGVNSDLCMALVGTSVTLQECGSSTSVSTTTGTSIAPEAGSLTSSSSSTTTDGTSSSTAWILDGGNNNNAGYLDVLSGVDAQFSDPLVLTDTGTGSPVGLGVSPLGEFGGVVPPAQMWAFSYSGQSTAAVRRGMQHT